MTCDEALEKLSFLRLAKATYKRLYDDYRMSLYKDEVIKNLIKSTSHEILKIESWIEYMELTDSYDQNTGEVNKIYRGDLH